MVRLTSVKILRPLPSAARIDKSDPIEIQFISRLKEGPAWLSFEIHSSILNAGSCWELCCTGTLEISPEIQFATESTAWEVPNDLILLQKAKDFDPHLLSGFEKLKMSSGKLCGHARHMPESSNQDFIDPTTLAPLLSLGPLSLLDQRLPVKYRIASIETLQLRADSIGSATSAFAITTKALRAGGAMSKIELRCDADTILTAGIRYTATELMPPKPVTSSLFFKPGCLPDITKHIELTHLSIQRLVQLLTHKWPMCDIAIRDVSFEVQARILKALVAGGPRESHQFRSVVMCQKSEHFMDDDRIRVVEELPSGLKAHLIFASPTASAQTLHPHLQSQGLACIFGSKHELDQQYSDSFEYLGQITGLDNTVSTLWRKRYPINSSSAKRRRFIFSSRNTSLEGDLHIGLRPPDIERFIAQHLDERFDAILLDDIRNSILLDWPGKALIPWLRYLTNHAKSILWITTNTSSSPFVNVAGTLLRTLQAEQPSLAVCWLVVDQPHIEFAQKVNDAHHLMLQGDNEIKLEVCEKETRITRYVPDDDLSLATGVSLPHQVRDPIEDRDYALTLAAPKELVVLSYDSIAAADSKYSYFDGLEDVSYIRSREQPEVGHGRVKVVVMASLISSDDLAAYKGHSHICESDISDNINSSQDLGIFFAGKVLASTTSSFHLQSSVVGWTEGAHASIVDVPESNLFLATSENHSQSLAEFTSLSTAIATMDGHIRARKDDHLELTNIYGMLREAFTIVRHHLQAALSKYRHPCSQIFKISISNTQELLVNGTPINDITNYLSTHLPAFSLLWKSHKPFTSVPQVFAFVAHKEAFATATAHTFPTILTHNNSIPPTPHTPIYHPSNPLPCPSSGTYIIIGGLGGLGQYICHHLLSHGRKSLHIISRTGLSTSSARHFQKSLLSTFPSATIRIITADACFRDQMSEILASIRRGGEAIRGVINLAMVLGDAPLANMTAEEWDRALRTKVQSSWVLHELTLDDDLDVFILFSSIASVLGNRGQGSYNVGNAFLNALAAWRRKQGRVGVAVALGAMVDRGVLASLHHHHSSPSATPTASTSQNLDSKLSRSGLSRLYTQHLSRILAAAFRTSRHQLQAPEPPPETEDAIIVTGLDLFVKDTHGNIITPDNSRNANTVKKDRVFWTDLPEFGHLSRWQARPTEPRKPSIKEKLAVITWGVDDEEETSEGGASQQNNGRQQLHQLVRTAFLAFLAETLGFDSGDGSWGTGTGGRTGLGMDSLSAVGAQYWCCKELGVDVSVREILEAESIEAFVGGVCERIVAQKKAGGKGEGIVGRGEEGKETVGRGEEGNGE
ncbi:MAG: hypothetical protein LQ343_002509 [Gyalolechia ehrenbergii]|nr:MAG: hypothetical protein LQ343_002509 [Gyalolechia ehrenbergii]